MELRLSHNQKFTIGENKDIIRTESVTSPWLSSDPVRLALRTCLPRTASCGLFVTRLMVWLSDILQRETRGSVTLKIVPSYRNNPVQCEVTGPVLSYTRSPFSVFTPSQHSHTNVGSCVFQCSSLGRNLQGFRALCVREMFLTQGNRKRKTGNPDVWTRVHSTAKFHHRCADFPQ